VCGPVPEADGDVSACALAVRAALHARTLRRGRADRAAAVRETRRLGHDGRTRTRPRAGSATKNRRCRTFPLGHVPQRL